MDTYASKMSNNIKKWKKLHEKSADIEVRTNPNYAIKQIVAMKNLIKTDGNTTKTLEVGCGFGRNLLYLIKQNFSTKYYGIDMTDTAIQKASTVLSESLEKGILGLSKGNAGIEIKFPDASFDCVFDIMSAITFITDENEREQYFNEVIRVLKPGGVYFFLTGRKEGVFNDILPDEKLLGKGYIKRKLDSMIERVYTFDEITTLLKGLDKVKLEVTSEHTRAFGDETFYRDRGFWFGAFRKES